MQVFSPEWATAYQKAINENEAYKKASEKWDLGKIALVLNRDADSIAVLLDLLNGKCLGAESLSEDAVESDATFVIAGDEATWQEVLNGKLAPLMGIMRGKLKLTKGSIGKLMPYTAAATELVNSAQTVPTEF